MSYETKILVVDDEKEARELITDLLQDEGYLIDTAESGEEVVEKARKEIFGVVILDMKLNHGMDGFETLKRLISENPNMCIIILTAYGTTPDVVRFLKEGASDFLKKPFDNEELIVRVKKAIAKWDIHQQLQQQFLQSIECLSSAIDANDPWTANHSIEVTKYVMIIGDRLQLSQDEKENLRLSALLHDIGKIGVPNEILWKPVSPLPQEEFAIIKMHPLKGIKVIERFEGLREIIPGILHHHEKFDGNGYPDNLKGENIPLQARIIAVADAYDAMASNRPYRPALSKEVILEQIRNGIRNQFDPEIGEVFLTYLEG